LHLLEHKAVLDQADQGKLAQAVQVESAKALAKSKGDKPKDPSESINYKDLGPSGRIQLAKRAGLDVTADEAANLADEHMPPESAQAGG
jgi:hypothetical protein